MENKAISQKEYLKKYISFGDDGQKKKKKKKKHKAGTKTVKIIDDDIDLKNMRSIDESEFDIRLEGEDAPQIAGIIDERGPVDFSDRKRWKIITENDEGDLAIISDDKVDMEMASLTNNTNRMERRNDEMNARHSENDANLSPPRSRHSKHERLDSSLHRRSKDNDSHLSPPIQPKNRQPKNYDSNLSPPRQSKNSQSKNYDSDLSLPRQSRNDDSDLSPPRQSRNNDSDFSPPRRSKNYDSDMSPPRRITKHRISTHSTSGRNHRSSDNRDSSSDFSPPKKHKRDTDGLYENRKDKKSSNLNASRSKERHARRDTSPHSSSRKVDRRHDYIDKNSSRSSRQDISRSSKDKRRREYEDRDYKSRQYSDVSERRKRSRWDKETDDPEYERAEHSRDRDDRMTKTLDGKKAGLQDAKALREETEAHKRREMEQFSKMNKTVSGVGQAPVMRDKTGRIRNLEAEAAEEREREIQKREMNEKYSKWGKGLKQVKDHEEKLKNDLYEMSKPLARYADDADLDKELREKEIEGDTMLEYIKQKQIKEGKRKPDPPKYQGSYAPNRFGIKPGRRWDGVDRSNGYERKWFESQNEKTARQEEAYKWSMADM